MSNVLDTLEVVFSADVGPLAVSLKQVDAQLLGLRSTAALASVSLQSMAAVGLSAMNALSSGAYSAGAQAGAAFARGISGAQSAVAQAAAGLAAAASAALQRVGSVNIPVSVSSTGTVASAKTGASASGGKSGGSSGNVTMPLVVDSVKLGEVVVRSIAQAGNISGKKILEI